MKLIIRAFRIQKAGNAFEECEDKSYPSYLNKEQSVYELSDQNLCKLGIADGATEGMLSGEWAEILLKASCRSNIDSSNINILVDKATKGWDSWLKNYLDERDRHKKPIMWYEEPGFKTGSFSTLLCLIIHDSEIKKNVKWQATAVGDSCLFHVREKQVIQSFPLNHSSDFGNRPSLISSNPLNNKRLTESNKMIEEDWLPHDSFYLMTDALACWFLQERENGNSPWLSYPFVINNDKGIKFGSWVECLRKSRYIKNDDVTLIHVGVTK